MKKISFRDTKSFDMPSEIRRAIRAIQPHGYEVEEFDLVNGTMKRRMLKRHQTKMRMDDPTNLPFEKYTGVGDYPWKQITPEEFNEWYQFWKEENEKKFQRTSMKKEAESYADATAWVRTYLTEDELEGDPIIQRLLETADTSEAKIVAGALAKRIDTLLREKEYDEYHIQNMHSTSVDIDYKQLYKLVDEAKERIWERETEEEWRELKKQLQTETDPEKRKQIEQQIRELEDMEYEGSKREILKKKSYEVGTFVDRYQDWIITKRKDGKYQAHISDLKPEIFGPTVSSVKRQIDKFWEETVKRNPEAENKWQKQKEVVPFGLGERGWLAYEPYKRGGSESESEMALYWNTAKELFFEKGNRWSSVVHQLKKLYPSILKEQLEDLVDHVRYYLDQYKIQIESKKPGAASLDDAIEFYIRHSEILGLPGEIDFKKRLVHFSTGKKMKWEDFIQRFIQDSQTRKKSDFGFFDSPVDLGKDPKGDFPSSKWLPKGHEDDVVNEDVTTASINPLKREKLYTEGQKLDPKLLDDAIWRHINSYTEDEWFENYGEKYIDDLIETAWEHGKKLSSFTIEKSLEDKTKEDWLDMYGEDEFNSWKENLSGYQTLEELHQDYSQIALYYESKETPIDVERQSQKEPQKEARESFLTEEQEMEIAEKYGPEYNTALNHIYDAIKNGHTIERAFAYAINEMKKIQISILPSKLTDAVKEYLKGL